MRRRIRMATFSGVTATALAAALSITMLTGGASQGEDIIVGQGVDHLPSHSATDWVTYADHVVVVTVADEEEIPPTQAELDRGEGVIGRHLTLKINKVLWSRDGARPAPKTWEYSAIGWQFKNGDVHNRTKMALADQPRVESGHRYIMAMEWEPARCSPGDKPAPAQWRGLGEGSEIPFDDGVIGKGELAGRPHSPAKAQQAAAGGSTETGLEQKLAGQSADALVQALKVAKPEPSKQLAPVSAQNTCS